MDRLGTGSRLRPAWVVAVALLAAGCAGHGALELVLLDPAGTNLAEVVDSESARRLLVEILADEPQSQRANPSASLLGVTSAVREGSVRPSTDFGPAPSQAQLRELGRAMSIDFAALSFACSIGADEKSRAVQSAFDRALDDGATRSEEILRRPGGFPYTVLFAPGWLYRSHPKSGADFARQRQLLDRLGVANHLIETAESGSIEDNAVTIAAAVHELARDQNNLILISTSKAGPEVALALSRLVAPEDAASVVGWINAGGAFRGTPLADRGIRPPFSWLIKLIFWIENWDRAGLMSMATGPVREGLEGVRLPDPVAVINVVAVPLSGTVARRAYGGYRVLRRQGPNDGVVLLADAIWPGGANLVALGSDHFLVDFQEDTRGLGLLRAVDHAVTLHRGRLGVGALGAGCRRTV